MKSCIVVKTLLLTSLILTAIAQLPSAFVSANPQERKLGVKIGDWAEYGNITVTWNSNNPNATEPPENLVLFNSTEWFRIEVFEIEETFVTFRNTTQFKNGSQTIHSAYIDVAEGYGNGSLTFVSAGLGQGDSIYGGEEYGYINQTIKRTYVNVERETNYLNLEVETSSPSTPPEVTHVSFNLYWDRETGILTERRISLASQLGVYQTSWTESTMVIDTNLWEANTEPPPPPTLPAWIPGLGILMALFVGAIIIYQRRKAKFRTRDRVRRRRALKRS